MFLQSKQEIFSHAAIKLNILPESEKSAMGQSKLAGLCSIRLLEKEAMQGFSNKIDA